MSPGNKCAVCHKALKKDNLTCAVCKLAYDIECVSMTVKRYDLMEQKANWKCPSCCKLPKTGNAEKQGPSNVTLRSKKRDEVSPGPGPVAGGQSNVVTPTKEDSNNFAQEMQLFRAEFIAMRLEMSNISSKFDTLFLTVQALGDRIGSLEHRVQILEERPIATGTSSEVKELTDTVERLKHELNDRDQELLATEVEIAGVTETNNENPIHLAVMVAQKLNVELDPRDIVSAERIGMRRGAAGAQDGDGGGGDGRPRALGVRLARRALRDELLQAARRTRGADTAGFDLPGPPRRFYVNERLTRSNRQLFFRARQEGSRLNWKYIWTRDGRIYARRQPGAQAHRVRYEDDLVKIFGATSI